MATRRKSEKDEVARERRRANRYRRALREEVADKERMRRLRESGEITDAEVTTWLLGREGRQRQGWRRDPETTVRFYAELTGQLPGFVRVPWVFAPADERGLQDLSGPVELRHWGGRYERDAWPDAVLIVASELGFAQPPSNCLRDLQTRVRDAKKHVEATREGRPCPLCEKKKAHLHEEWVASLKLPTEKDVPETYRRRHRGYVGSLLKKYLAEKQPPAAGVGQFMIAGHGFDYIGGELNPEGPAP